MKNIKKMDEMEMNVNFKALRISWDFGILFLTVWVGMDWIQTRSYNGIALALWISQLLIYWAVQLFLKWKLGNDEE